MYIGIDLGTSEVKLLLLSDSHQLVATVGEKISISRPAAHWSEQDPAEWWSATGKAMAALRALAEG